MKKYNIFGLVSIIFGILAFLTTSAEIASAGIQKGHSSTILRYYGGSYKNGSPYASGHQHKHYDRYSRKLGAVNRHKHEHKYEYYGFTRRLPHGSKKIKFNNVVYRFHDGFFYRKCQNRGYDIVPSPVGALVRRLPYGHSISYRQGNKLYHYEGTYYKKVRQGYRVIEDPKFQITYYDDNRHSRFSSSKYRRACR